MRITRVVGLALAIAVAAGCGPGGEEPQAIAARITIQPGPGERPEKADTDEAVAVVAARLDALGIEALNISAGDVITVEIGDAADIFVVQRAVQANGVVDFSPQPGDEAVPAIGTDVSGQESLWAGHQVTAAVVGTEPEGGSTLTLTLTPFAAEILETWSTAHVGDYLMIVLDGRVVSTPVIQSPITGGEVVILIPESDEIGVPLEVLAALLASGPLPESWRRP